MRPNARSGKVNVTKNKKENEQLQKKQHTQSITDKNTKKTKKKDKYQLETEPEIKYRKPCI